MRVPKPPDAPAFDDFEPEAVAAGLERRIGRAREQIEEMLAQEPQALIPTLELIGEDLDRRFAPLRHLNSVASTEEVRKAYEKTLALFTDYDTWLGQHQGLYSAFKTLSESKDFPARPQAEQALVKHALTGFHLSGADLPDARREEVRGLLARLSKLGNRFETQLLDATEAWNLHVSDEAQCAGLPETVTALLGERAREKRLDGWLLTLDPGVVDAVLTHAQDRALRRSVYEAWTSRASESDAHAEHDNAPVIVELLAARHQLARTLGYDNFAEYALVERMADSAAEVAAFLHDLARRARPRAQEEFVELGRFAGECGLDGPLAPWDIGYYSEKLRKARYGLDRERLRRYFPLEHVLAGLRNLFRELYGLRFRDVEDAPVWHSTDVHVWELADAEGQPAGRLYLDLYARPGKRAGAWMDEGGHRLDLAGVKRRPTAFLTANFLRPAQGKPSLLAHDDVVTLCHELGHCLHHLLTQVGYPSVGGISGVEWDAVEFPSQLHEGFAWHPAGLSLLAADVDSGEAMPGELIEALDKSRSFHGALRLVRQLEFALFDLELHRLAQPATDIGEVRRVLGSVRQEVRVTPVADCDRFECGFSHIFAGGYAAGYYSYLWAEVMARDGFAAFTNGADLCADAGQRLAATTYADGGSRPARELFHDFRDRDPDPAALLATYGIS
ncbi:MAG: M3 family metallopeptidase [Gammaproteobacteria bacterium]|nr:M3 family metallopeptidase [Gammaproteobacteria bacterium]